ncbi:hypothetical protein XELAEV_18032420mg [Xenopus laevis]|uniref:Uncharacterized protein n=1 Tax=Xenopus laevis TaxID=8355 RepID=A0A974HGJ7_XENLA|nr:hypothetical protein XELAEV_18032420mg [Xenopus laevis]
MISTTQVNAADQGSVTVLIAQRETTAAPSSSTGYSPYRPCTPSLTGHMPKPQTDTHPVLKVEGKEEVPLLSQHHIKVRQEVVTFPASQ